MRSRYRGLYLTLAWPRDTTRLLFLLPHLICSGEDAEGTEFSADQEGRSPGPGIQDTLPTCYLLPGLDVNGKLLLDQATEIWKFVSTARLNLPDLLRGTWMMWQ